MIDKTNLDDFGFVFLFFDKINAVIKKEKLDERIKWTHLRDSKNFPNPG